MLTKNFGLPAAIGHCVCIVIFLSAGTNSMEPKFQVPDDWPKIIEHTEGIHISLSCRANGSSPLQISWYHNKTGIKEMMPQRHYLLKTWKLTIKSTTPSDAGKYKCRVCNNYGCKEKTTILRIQPRVHSVPKIMNEKFATLIAVEGNDVTLKCNVEQSQLEPFIVWYKHPNSTGRTEQELTFNGVQIMHSSTYNASEVFLRKVNLTDAGWYSCNASNAMGSAVSSIYLRIEKKSMLKKPQIIMTVKQYSSVHYPPYVDNSEPIKTVFYVYSGDKTNLKCPVHGKPKPTITWTRGDNPLPDGISNIHLNDRILRIDNVTREDANIYECLACNCLGCLQFTFNVLVIEPIGNKRKN